MNTKNNKIGTLYILKINDEKYLLKNKNLNISIEDKDIYKFGVTEQESHYKRLNQYSNYPELVIYYKIKNLYENKNKIKELVSYKYPIENYIKGYDYISGDIYEALKDIYNIIKDDIIQEMDLDRDIIENSFEKINIFYNDKVNVKYFDYIKKLFNEDNIISTTRFRNIHLRYLVGTYRDEIMINKKI